MMLDGWMDREPAHGADEGRGWRATCRRAKRGLRTPHCGVPCAGAGCAPFWRGGGALRLWALGFGGGELQALSGTSECVYPLSS
eukprot:5821505-Prymnesium_polylepis.1